VCADFMNLPINWVCADFMNLPINWVCGFYELA
jgi:rubredoxin